MSAPLLESFKQRGITLLGLGDGAMVPLRFSDRDAEHLATRRTCGVFDFSFMACVEVTGGDSLGFLQRLQTRNLSRFPPGRLAYTLFLRPDGTVLNDATVWRLGPQHYCLFTGRHADLDHVRALARNHRVSIVDRSSEHTVLAVQGSQSWRVISRCLSGLPATLPYYAFCDGQFEGAACRVAHVGYSGETGYELIANAEHGFFLWQALLAAGVDCGLVECGFEAADSLRIEAGHVLFMRELALPVDPFELGLTRLLDFYRVPAIGMEALRARRWREPARRFVGLIPECAGMTELELLIATENNAPARPASSVALLTSVCMSPVFGRPLGLGFVAAADRRPGTQVKLANGIRAWVARLPFYDPAKRLVRRWLAAVKPLR